MIGKAVRQGLSAAGFAVDWAPDGAILDIGLPKKDGMAILASLRELGNSMPVLIASARDSVRDRISRLDAGADDDLFMARPWL